MEPSVSQAVFLSYASQDAEAAGRIALALRGAGVEVWFDQSELRGGDAWDRKLRQQIRECVLFVALVSKNTDSRLEGYFRREWRLAIDRTRDMAEEKAFLLPVVIDETTDSTRRVPDKFHDVQWTRLPRGEGAEDFARYVRTLVKVAPSFASAPPREPAGSSGSAPPLMPEALSAGGRHLAVGRWWRAAVVALGVLLVGGVGWLKRDRVATWLGRAKPDLETIAVAHDCQPGVPADVELLGQSIVHNLTDGLCQLPKISVVAHEVVARLGSKPLDFSRIRDELGAEKLLTVSVKPHASGTEAPRAAPARPDYEVRVSLAETRTLRHLWGETFVRSSRDVPEVVESVSRDVIEALQIGLNAKDRARLEAFRLYQKGRYHWDKRTAEGLGSALACYERAIQVAPTYAPAQAGLANCYSLLPYYGGTSPAESYPRAKQAAERALKLDDTLADAHAALGLVLRDFERDWSGAEREFRRAIELNPKYATAHQWYAEYLAALGRHDESVRVMQRARGLAPLEPIIAAVLGWIHYLAGRPDDAIAELQQALERHPEFEVAYWFLSLAYAQKGLLGEAVTAAEHAMELSKGGNSITAALANLQARSGRGEKAEILLHQLQRRAAGAGYVSPYDLAVVEVGLGRRDRALDLLEQAVQARRWEVVNLRVDPLLAPLRSEARFAALVRRMGLPNP